MGKKLEKEDKMDDNGRKMDENRKKMNENGQIWTKMRKIEKT